MRLHRPHPGAYLEMVVKPEAKAVMAEAEP
jgi:hypothetical protein